MNTTRLGRKIAIVLTSIAIGLAGTAEAAETPLQAVVTTADFRATLLLTTDVGGFSAMWKKPTTPNLRQLGPVEVGAAVSAVFAYAGGRPDAAGHCQLVYTLRIEDGAGHGLAESDETPLCAGRMARPEFAAAEAVARITTDRPPGRYTVSARITDKVAGTTALAATPLVLTPAGSLFHYESVKSLDDMQALIRQRFALGATREALRRTFVVEGRGAVYPHPTQRGVEKYVYDIDLCGYYVWRWNVSADFDDGGLLRQAYVNGDIVFPDGPPKRIVTKGPSVPGRLASISRVSRPRPEATKGERAIEFLLLDADSDPQTIDDQAAMGAGPTRADPFDPGRLHVYGDVEPWRSIFDTDPAEPIASYAGDCAAVDARAAASGGRFGTPTKDVVDRLIKAMQGAQQQGQAAPR